MTVLVQEMLAFVIVFGAMTYAAMKLMPAAWRRAIAANVASLASRSGLSEANARRVEAKLSTGGACGSCDSCKACAAPTKEGDGTTFVAASPSEYRAIPIRRVS